MKATTRTDQAHFVDHLGPRSFWLEEALRLDPGAPCPPSRGDLSTDVCIVGGGFSGLWTAYELGERDPSLEIVLLEADICGAGGSGANGGVFDPGWPNILGLCRVLGETEGLRYMSALAAQTGELREWCARHQADVAFHEEGMVFMRAAEWQPEPDQAAVDFLAARGLGEKLRILDTEALRRIANVPGASGGLYCGDVATVQPARLARELRRVLLGRGVRIFEATPVTGLRSGKPVQVVTPQGTVRAQQLVITTGAWAVWQPAFRRALCPVVHSMVITEPVPDLLDEIGWKSHTGLGDIRNAFYYARRTDDGRVAIGGGGVGIVYDGRLGGAPGRQTGGAPARSGAARPASDRSDPGRPASRELSSLAGTQIPAEGLLWLLPQLRGVRFAHAWKGILDVTTAFLPFFVSSADGNVHAGLGFSGHGLAPTKLGGKTLASLVLQTGDEWATLGVVGPPMSKMPPEPLRWLLVSGLAKAITRNDLGRQRGRRGTASGRLAEKLLNRYRGSRRPRPAGRTVRPDF
jgi:glycine/D-amino acid oxidase-like deaminating enzyme